MSMESQLCLRMKHFHCDVVCSPCHLSLSLSPFTQAYKEKYIILRNSADHRCKVVEIQDSEDGDDTRETVKLNDTWTVQDKPSKSRGKYTFEVSFSEVIPQ